MTRVQKVVSKIISDIESKEVLEVACGCAEFSISSSAYATNINCIDLDDFRLNESIKECSNVLFTKMDATNMQFETHRFDTVVLYNAISHLETIINEVLTECYRVTKPGGAIYVISSFKMDKWTITERLIPILNKTGNKYTVETDNTFSYVRIQN